jgi:segregation and condensation protein A|tara:strand:- start:146 stop:790 length:645 start_codon:yes stop_codon:yes gene_type:complete
MSKNDLQLSKPPLNLLLNPTVLKAKKPWEIDVVLLLELFTDFLEKKGDKNLRLCANAALSSSLLYRLKVETFFIFEKLRNEQPLSNLADPPELLSLPYRYELYSTTLIDLLESLRTEIDSSVDTEIITPSKVTETEPTIELDQYFVKIKEMLDPFRDHVLKTLNDLGDFLLSSFTSNMSSIDSTRAFILLLFLAMEGLISIQQEGDDIKVVARF